MRPIASLPARDHALGVATMAGLCESPARRALTASSLEGALQ
jgi:hypothetical protein